MFTSKEQEIINWGLQNGKTKEEIKTAVANYRLGIQPAAPTPVEQKPSFAEDFLGDIKQTASSIKDRTVDLFKNSKTISEQRGNQSVAETALQGTGNAAGYLSGIFGDIITGVGKAALPQSAETGIKQGIGTIIKPIVNTDTVKNIIATYNGLDDRTKRNVDAALGIGSLALDVATSGIVGKGSGAVAGKVARTGEQAAQLGSDVISTTAKKTGAFRDLLGDIIDPISQQAKTVLKETPKQKVSIYAEQALKAIKDAKAITPLELAGERAKNALKLIDDSINRIGANKQEITKSLGQFDATDVITQARKGLRESTPNLGLTFMEDGTLRTAPGRISKITSQSDLKMLQEVDSLLKEVSTRGATLQRVDDAIDAIQEMIYKRTKTLGAEPINTEIQGLLKNTIGKANSALKKIAGADYAKLNELYAKTLNTRNQLAVNLGKDYRAAGSLMKKLFSPASGNTKQLFNEIKKLTGIDLADEATLAREVMDAVGDVRQKSLLKAANLNPQTLLKEVVDKVMGKIPTSKIERIIKSAKE